VALPTEPPIADVRTVLPGAKPASLRAYLGGQIGDRKAGGEHIADAGGNRQRSSVRTVTKSSHANGSFDWGG
jgi:hypothetical protein